MTPSPPTPDPRNPTDTTTPVPSEANWSSNVLPPILGRLDHAPGFFARKTKTYLRDPQTGQILHDPDNNPIKAFAHIPPCISTTVEPWRVEAYFRLHGDFTYLDLWARQPNWYPKPNYGAKNRLNNLRARTVRAPLGMRCWSTRYSGRPAKTLVETVEKLSKKQIAQNTTWKVTPTGIAQPGNPGHVLPLGYFLENGVSHVPSKEVAQALKLLGELQAKAKAKGKRHWSELEKEDLPKGWMARLSKSRAKAPTLVEAKSEATDDSDEESEVEPVSKKALRKTRGKKVTRKVETSDESDEEESDSGNSETDGGTQDSDSGEEESDGGEEASSGGEDESDSGEESSDSGEEVSDGGEEASDGGEEEATNEDEDINDRDEETDGEVEATDGEEQFDGEEFQEPPWVEGRSKRLRTCVEHSSEDGTEGSTAAGMGKTQGSKHTLVNSVEANVVLEGISYASKTGQASKASKRKREDFSTESWSEDKPFDSNTVKISHEKVKKRKAAHSSNVGSEEQLSEAIAGQHTGHAPRNILDAQSTLNWSKAQKIQTLEALLIGRNTLSAHTIQVIHETLPTFSEQTLHETLSGQHALTDADLAFVFSGFLPSRDVSTPQNPQQALPGQNSPGVEPSSCGVRSNAPSHPTTSSTASPRNILFQPNNRSGTAPAPLPQWITPGRPQHSPPQAFQPAPASTQVIQMAQSPLDHRAIRAQYWADQRLFVHGELAKLSNHNANPQLTVANNWYGALDQPWYYQRPAASGSAQHRLPDIENDNFLLGRSSQQVIGELRQAARDENLVFFDGIALDLLMSDVNATDFAREYYTRATNKVEELAAQDLNGDEVHCRNCYSPITNYRCQCEIFVNTQEELEGVNTPKGFDGEFDLYMDLDME